MFLVSDGDTEWCRVIRALIRDGAADALALGQMAVDPYPCMQHRHGFKARRWWERIHGAPAHFDALLRRPLFMCAILVDFEQMPV